MKGDMITLAQKQSFEARTSAAPDADAVRTASAAAKTGNAQAMQDVAVALCHAAFAAPETARAIYAAFRTGWLGTGEVLAMPRVDAAPLSRAFWDSFWAQLEDTGPSDPLQVTGRVVASGALLDPSMLERSEAASRTHPKAANAASRPTPPRLSLDELAKLPQGSLGHDFWRQIVDNQFDLEVLDRDALSLSLLPPALRYLNTRILQMHDVWHIMGPFETTALHEIAISAFQQEQFGHGYSAMFLAVVASRTVFQAPDGVPVIFCTIAEASRHGAESPSFMAIAWEKEWHLPVAEIRARHGLKPFKGTFPADLFEQFRSAA